MTPHSAERSNPPTLTARLADAARDLFDSIVAADLPEHCPDGLVTAIDQLARIFDELQPAGGPIDSRLPTVPAHARIGRVPWKVVRMSDQALLGEARFRLIHAGTPGIAHGGAVAFLLDEVMGVFANSRVEGVARTAQISVNYKSPTPVEVDLNLDVRHVRTEGRKWWFAASLTDTGGVVLAQAEGLFVTVAS